RTKGRRSGEFDKAGLAFLQEELNAVGQRVVELDLGDGGVDGDLQLRPVELSERAQDELVILVVRVDQQRIARSVGGDPDAFEERAAAARGGACAQASAPRF